MGDDADITWELSLKLIALPGRSTDHGGDFHGICRDSHNGKSLTRKYILRMWVKRSSNKDRESENLSKW